MKKLWFRVRFEDIGWEIQYKYGCFGLWRCCDNRRYKNESDALACMWSIVDSGVAPDEWYVDEENKA